MEKCRKSAENAKYTTHEILFWKKKPELGKNKIWHFCKIGADNLQKAEREENEKRLNALKNKKLRGCKKKQKGRTMQNILHKNSGIKL